jgi:hypothetical protein
MPPLHTGNVRKHASGYSARNRVGATDRHSFTLAVRSDAAGGPALGWVPALWLSRAANAPRHILLRPHAGLRRVSRSPDEVRRRVGAV